jgi:HD-GYP domain-containing protein (c-di-GMP phosphodiesterase class II)
MLTGRPYRPAYNLTDTIIEVQRHAGTQFDNQVVKAFLILAMQRGSSFFTSSNHGAEKTCCSPPSASAPPAPSKHCAQSKK